MKNTSENKKIILFDGICNLCNNAVQFIIKHDKNDIFRFAALQGDLGKKLLRERGLEPDELDSIYLIEPGVAYYKESTAALEIAAELSGPYSFLKHFKFIPEGIRDSIYQFIANNRYKWYGKREECMIPTPKLKAKFLD